MKNTNEIEKQLQHKADKFLEQKAREINPEALIVLPWNFKDEIVNREKKYISNGGKLMFAMPYPHVITNKGEVKL